MDWRRNFMSSKPNGGEMYACPCPWS